MTDIRSQTPTPSQLMDFNEVLQLGNDLLFAKTGKHLDNVQEAMVCGRKNLLGVEKNSNF